MPVNPSLGLIHPENSKTVIDSAMRELGVKKNLTENQYKYLELALLGEEEVERLVGFEIVSKSDKIRALSELIPCNISNVYSYFNDIVLNDILFKMGMSSFSRILPAYLNNIEKGIRNGDQDAMHHAKSLVLKLLDIKEKTEVHLHQNNYLNVDNKSLTDIVKGLREKHDIVQ